MPTRNATATWEGGLQQGKGRFTGESESIRGSYSAGSRFRADEPGTNPEELLAAAHASCFSMALSAALEKAGLSPERVETEAACTVEKVGDGFSITTMRLRSRARVPGASDEKFQELAGQAKEGCPVSRALAGVDIRLEATLDS